MEALYKERALCRANLDERNYLPSLLGAALDKKQIGEETVQKLQGSLLNVLAVRCREYTGGKSGSVRTATAEGILQSIVFTIGIWLKEFDEPDAALHALLQTGAGEAYGAGLQRLRKIVRSTRTYYELMKRQSIYTDNYAYNATLTGGITGFFQLYNPEFFAQELHITADYPVALFPEGYQGIEFIRLYLQRWKWENSFCRAFPSGSVKRALTLYAIACCDTVENMMGNLFEIVLSAALSCAVSEEAAGLEPTAKGKAAVKKALCGDASLPLQPYLKKIWEEEKGLKDKNVQAYAEEVCHKKEIDLKRNMLLLAGYFD